MSGAANFSEYSRFLVWQKIPNMVSGLVKDSKYGFRFERFTKKAHSGLGPSEAPAFLFSSQVACLHITDFQVWLSVSVMHVPV